jgi:[ribosomal protein S18]-alanine N-acetyltransferase
MQGKRIAEPMIIRPAQPQDCGCIQIIEQEASVFPWSHDAIAHELSNPRGLNFIAQDDGQTICGFVFSSIVADEISIHNIATHPKFQRRGIARRLLETTIERARERGAANAYLEVRSKNSRAIDLYQKLGFTVTSIRKKYYSGDHDDALLMHKRMDSIV